MRALQLRPSELDALLKRLKQNPFQNLEDVNEWIPKVSWKTMKTKPKTLMLLFLITISFLSAKPAHAASLSDEGRINPAPPTDAKGSLISYMPPGTAILCEYSLVSFR